MPVHAYEASFLCDCSFPLMHVHALQIATPSQAALADHLSCFQLSIIPVHA